MTRSATVRTLLAFVAGVAFIGAVVLVDQSLQARFATEPQAARGGAPAPEAERDVEEDENEEAAEQAEKLERRLEAWEAAKERKQVGQQRIAAAGPAAAGWTGETPFDQAADDWEPAIAADPTAPWVYGLVTRYASDKPCPGNCPTPYIALRISQDGGATWAPSKPLCACKGGGQFDPIIEVVPGTGAVYAVYMSGYNVVFVKSTDHGQTWSAPVKTYGNVSWNDKPVLAVSDDGRDVYVPFNGPTGGDPWLAQSHDFGATWTQTKLVNSDRYYFAFDADVAPDGTVYLSQSSLLYGGGGNKGTTPTDTIDHHVFVSTNRGSTWTDRVAAQVQAGLACTAAGCSPDFYLGHSALSADATGALVLLYDGATTTGGQQTVSARRSTDRGASWSAPVALSKNGEEATSPAVESRGSGDVRAWWMETNGGNVDAWNVWYRSSTNGGATWTAPVKISDATAGAAYKTAAGFQEIYGDYGEAAINSAGKTVAIWGEGFSWDGPGGVWVNREQ
jgi:hypothetical protein